MGELRSAIAGGFAVCGLLTVGFAVSGAIMPLRMHPGRLPEEPAVTAFDAPNDMIEALMRDGTRCILDKGAQVEILGRDEELGDLVQVTTSTHASDCDPGTRVFVADDVTTWPVAGSIAAGAAKRKAQVEASFDRFDHRAR